MGPFISGLLSQAMRQGYSAWQEMERMKAPNLRALAEADGRWKQWEFALQQGQNAAGICYTSDMANVVRGVNKYIGHEFYKGG